MYIYIFVIYIYIYIYITKNVGETELSEEKKLVFHLRKILYFVFIYILPLVLLLISSFQIHNLELAR